MINSNNPPAELKKQEFDLAELEKDCVGMG